MGQSQSSGWKRGTRLWGRLQKARREDKGWGAIFRRAAERVYDEELVDPDTMKRLRALRVQLNEYGYDPFGFNPDYLKWSVPLGAWFYRNYFRTHVHGIDNIPDGPVLLIANHSGQIPVDGMMIALACLLDKQEPRMVRSMVERWVGTLPFVSWFFARTGQILGTRDNFRRLIQQNNAILVFPEGVGGISKTYDKAYQLQRFGFGFMRLAIEDNLPIVPVAVIGGEEQAPAFFNVKGLARLMGAPAFPITPTFPLLGPLGMFPYPVRYHLYFGEAMRFEGNPDDEDRALEERVDQVKETLQTMIQHGLEQREGIFT